MSDRRSEPESTSADDAFALVGNDIRVTIIKELGDAQGTRGPPAVLPFAELRSRVDPDIDSSRFNYHLQQLVGHFVASVDDGYRLRPEGTALYRTLRAGTFDHHRSVPPVDIETDCHFCDGSLEAFYDDGRFTIRCGRCEHTYYRNTIPPSAVDSGITESLVRRCDQHQRHLLLAAARGVCPVCIQSLETQLLHASEVTLTGDTTGDLTVFAHASCSHCGHQQYMSVGSALLYHPDLISFFQERGLDVTSKPVWELAFAATDRDVDIRSTDPWRVALAVTRDGDELELVIDEDLAVTERTVR